MCECAFAAGEPKGRSGWGVSIVALNASLMAAVEEGMSWNPSTASEATMASFSAAGSTGSASSLKIGATIGGADRLTGSFHKLRMS